MPLKSLKVGIEKKDYKNTVTLPVTGKIQPADGGRVEENSWKMFR